VCRKTLLVLWELFATYSDLKLKQFEKCTLPSKMWLLLAQKPTQNVLLLKIFSSIKKLPPKIKNKVFQGFSNWVFFSLYFVLAKLNIAMCGILFFALLIRILFAFVFLCEKYFNFNITRFNQDNQDRYDSKTLRKLVKNLKFEIYTSFWNTM
jgi:hypothetical protein